MGKDYKIYLVIGVLLVAAAAAYFLFFHTGTYVLGTAISREDPRARKAIDRKAAEIRSNKEYYALVTQGVNGGGEEPVILEAFAVFELKKQGWNIID